YWTLAMKALRYILLAVLILEAPRCLGGDSRYHSNFLTACEGKHLPFWIKSPSLVDTNNYSPTAGRTAISLSSGAVAGVRLGMSMDEVVSLWGKPVTAGLSCGG